MITTFEGFIAYRKGGVVLLRRIVRSHGGVFRYAHGEADRERPNAALILRYRNKGDWHPSALRAHAKRVSVRLPTGYAMTPKLPDGPARLMWWLNEPGKLGLALEAQLGPGHSSLPLETDHD